MSGGTKIGALVAVENITSSNKVVYAQMPSKMRGYTVCASYSRICANVHVLFNPCLVFAIYLTETNK